MAKSKSKKLTPKQLAKEFDANSRDFAQAELAMAAEKIQLAIKSLREGEGKSPVAVLRSVAKHLEAKASTIERMEQFADG